MQSMLSKIRGALLSLIVGTSATLAAVSASLDQAPGQAPGQAPTADSESGARRTTLRVLTDSDFPPFNYYEEDNTLTGFNVDIARAICIEMAVVCDIRVRPWNELLPALQKGEADAVIASHKLSPNALLGIDFTDRYYHTPGRFVGKRTLPRLEITPEGLENKRIAVTKGTAHEAYVRAFFRDSTIRAYETPELARDAVLTGAAEVLFDDGISLAFWLNGTASKACCEFKGGPFAEPKYFGDGIGIAVSRADGQLKGQINAALRKLRENGRYEETVLRYFPLRAF